MRNNNADAFSDALTAETGHSEKTHALAVAWYLHSLKGAPPSIGDICTFLEEHAIRLNSAKNSGRIRAHFAKENGFSFRRDGLVAISRAKNNDFKEKYGNFLAPPKFSPPSSVLPEQSSQGLGNVFDGITHQINSCVAIEAFDAAAVMMRRFLECLIIKVFNMARQREKILDANGEYLSFEKLISAIEKNRQMKLSRETPRTLKKLKSLGDRGAHSTTHTILGEDVREILSDFRAAVSDLRSLIHPSLTPNE